MLTFILAGLFIATGIAAWACCRLAGRADAQAEQLTYEQATQDDKEAA